MIELEMLRFQNWDYQFWGRQKALKSELHEKRVVLESIYKQQSRELWLREGDLNIGFFHASLIMQRRRNHINAIKDETEWRFREDHIEAYFVKEFTNLY